MGKATLYGDGQISTVGVVNASSAVPAKRAQVPRACSNCRKMHAGCDTERPCRRCTQNGLESTCMDLPRKKRITRKRQKTDEDSNPNSSDEGGCSPPLAKHRHQHSHVHIKKEGHSIKIQNQVMPLAPPMIPSPSGISQPSLMAPSSILLDSANYLSFEDPSEKLWEDTYSELFGSPLTSPDIEFANIPSPPLPSSSPEASLISFSDPLLLSEYSEDTSIGTGSISDTIDGANASPLPSADDGLELGLLLQQITELKENNKNLENRLTSVTKELLDVKKTSPNPFILNPPSSALSSSCSSSPAPSTSFSESNSTPSMNWVSFGGQDDLAISVWRTGIDQSGSNYLIECNQKFIDLLGYPLEVLKNNFTCRKLLKKPELSGENGRNWPKKTQIVTATGLKEVYVTVSPVNDQYQAPKYYILHILEICS